jgi:hypothetical protein
MAEDGRQDALDRDENGGGVTDRVNIDYIKGALFRTINPSGLIGSVTPQAKVQIGLFSERQAIPQRVTYSLREDGRLGDTLEVVGRDAIVRELEAVVTLDRDTAKELLSFLEKLLTVADQTVNEQK